MNKYLLLFAFCLLPFAVLSQDIVSAKGEHILPEKGDWAVMFDAAPFLRYAGNAFNGSGNNSVITTFPNGYANTLVLKNMKSVSRALRIKLRAGFSSNTIDSTVVFLGGTLPYPTVKDSRTVSKQHITIGIGKQASKGKGRLQGYAGGELLFGYSSGDTTYSYGGGSLTQFNWLHTNTFGQERGITSINQGSTLGINFHLVFGVEYFFAPKMSLSAEYSWGMGYSKTNDGKKSKEQWDFSNGRIKTTSVKIPGPSSFVVDNDNNAGSINLAFYF